MNERRTKGGPAAPPNNPTNLPVMLPPGPPDRGGVADAGVPAYNPLAALELGFHTRLLRTLQESVWATDPLHIHDVDPVLESIRRRLLALSDRLNEVQFGHFREVAARIEERHEIAAVFGGRVRNELHDEVGDPEEVTRLYLRRLDERSVVLRTWQREDWHEVRLLSWKAVEGDRRLEAWWEIGLRLADMMLRVGTPEAPAIWTEEDVEGLLAAVAKLPGEEKAWVEDILPSTPPSDPRFPFLLNEAYRDLQEFIPAFEQQRHRLPQNPVPAPTGKKRPSRAETPDDYEANILVKKYLDAHPRATIREVAKAVKLSIGKVSQLDAWRQRMAERKAVKPPPRRKERPLTDKMLAARGQKDDPAARATEEEEKQAIWRSLIERAGPEERVKLYEMDPDQREALIEAVREQYEEYHREADD